MPLLPAAKINSLSFPAKELNISTRSHSFGFERILAI